MSNPEGNGGQPVQEAFTSLESAVGEALKRLEVMTRRAEAAEQKSAELTELMRRVSGSPEEAGDLLTRLKRLEDENADLRDRLHRGRQGVDRLLAKVQFLENQR